MTSPRSARETAHWSSGADRAVGQGDLEEVGVLLEGGGALLFAGEAMERGEGVVEVDEATVDVGDEDRVGHAGERRAQLLAAVAQGLFGALALADVGDERAVVQQHAVVVEDRLRKDLDRARA